MGHSLAKEPRLVEVLYEDEENTGWVVKEGAPQHDTYKDVN